MMTLEAKKCSGTTYNYQNSRKEVGRCPNRAVLGGYCVRCYWKKPQEETSMDDDGCPGCKALEFDRKHGSLGLLDEIMQTDSNTYRRMKKG